MSKWMAGCILALAGCSMTAPAAKPVPRNPVAAPQAPDKDPFANLEANWCDEESDFDSVAECDRIIAANQDNPLVLAKALRWKGIQVCVRKRDTAHALDLFDKAERLLADARVSEAGREAEQAQVDMGRAVAYRYDRAFEKAQKLLLRVVENEHLQTIEHFRLRQDGKGEETVKVPTRCWALMSLGYVLQMQAQDPDVTCKMMAELVEKYPGTPVACEALLCWADALKRDQRYRESQEKLDQAAAILGKDNWMVRDKQDSMERLRDQIAREKPGYQGRYKELLGMIAAWDKSDDPLRDFNNTGGESECSRLLRELFRSLGKNAARPYLVRAYLDDAISSAGWFAWVEEAWWIREVWDSFKEAGRLPLLRKTVAEFARQNATDACALAVCACVLSPLDNQQNLLAPLSPLFDDALKVAADNSDRAAILRLKAGRLNKQKPGEAAALLNQSLLLDHDPEQSRGLSTAEWMFEAWGAAGNETEVDDCLAKCLEWFPGCAYEVHCAAGEAYQKMGSFAKAEEQYRLTLQTLGPRTELWNVGVRTGLAVVLSREGKTKEALAVAEEALTWAFRLEATVRADKDDSATPSFEWDRRFFRSRFFEAARRHLEGVMDLSGMNFAEVRKRAAKRGRLHPHTWMTAQLAYSARGFLEAVQTTGGAGPKSEAGRPAPEGSLNLPKGTDADLAAALKDRQDWRELNLSGSKVTDDGLAMVSDLKGLQTLDLNWTPVTDAGLARVKNMEGLQFLFMSHTQVTDAGLARLKDMKGLCVLDLSDTKVTDAGLASLKQMTGLLRLSLNRTQVTAAGTDDLKAALPDTLIEVPIPAEEFAAQAYLNLPDATDADLAALKDKQDVRYLNLWSSKVTDAGLANLKGMNALQKLEVGNTQVTDAGLACLKEMKFLGELGLSYSHVTDAGLAYLKELKGLKNLSLQHTNVTDAGLAQLKELQGLQELNLRETQAGDDGLAALKQMKGLRKLNLRSTPVTDAGLANVKEMKDLDELDLSYTNVTDAGLANIRDMKDMQVLYLYSIPMTDAGLANLERMKALQRLYLDGCGGVTDAGLAHLKGMKDLEILTLAGTQVTDAGLTNLEEMNGLRQLDLANCRGVTDAGLAHLKGMKDLENLNLLGTQVTNAGLASLKRMRHLQNLELAGTQVTEAGLAELKKMPALRSIGLPLSNMNVTDALLAQLCEIKGLQALDLSGSGVTDAGIAHLKKLRNLDWLILGHVAVTDAGFAELKTLYHMQDLRLDYTQVTDAGLANLKEMKELRSLSLRGTQVTNVGLAILKELKNLGELDLQGTGVTDDGLATLKEMKGLWRVYLADTRVTADGAATLKEALSNMIIIGPSGNVVELPAPAEAPVSPAAKLAPQTSLTLPNATDADAAALKDRQDLREIYLAHTQVTDAGVANLHDLRNLNTLDLTGTNVTDAALVNLKELKGLHALLLSGTQVTDAGLANLKEMKDLERLYLSQTRVSDVGLRKLKEMKSLRLVFLYGTDVTDAGLTDLKAALPEAQICK